MGNGHHQFITTRRKTRSIAIASRVSVYDREVEEMPCDGHPAGIPSMSESTCSYEVDQS